MTDEAAAGNFPVPSGSPVAQRIEYLERENKRLRAALGRCADMCARPDGVCLDKTAACS